MVLAGQQHLGPYRLLNVVKTGQTSQVWAVIKDTNQERYALKVLLSEFCGDRQHLRLIRHEYEVGRALEHERVIHVYDFAIDRQVPYLVMEYFPLPNMREIILHVLRHVAFLIPTMIERAAEGLAHVNERGWIHRDVKPDNFLVSLEADVKLIDFALAQRRKGPLGRLVSGRSRIQGTRSYMSPEQIRGKPLGTPSDVYSFGCTMFHLLTGQPPFTGASSNELLTKHLRSAPPSLDVYNRNVTPEFADLIRSTMAKRPEDRPKSLGAFLREFRAIEVFKVPPKRPVPAARGRNGA